MNLETNKKLREYRDACALSGNQISNITGISLSTVFEWLGDKRPMPPRALRLLELELGIAEPGWIGAKGERRRNSG